jgi:alpha-D-xyloside xylohydrolase
MKKLNPVPAILFIVTSILTVSLQSCENRSFTKTDDGIIVHLGKTAKNAEQSIRLQVISDKIIHVTAVPAGTFPQVKSLMTVSHPDRIIDFVVEEKEDHVALRTYLLNASVSLKTGEVIFTDLMGKTLLAEKQEGGKTFVPVTIQGQSYYAVRQQFESPPEEALYGLGANQTSFMNMKGKDADLYQYNTLAVVPFVISNKNWGLLWDNYSRTKFGDIRDYRELSGLRLYNKSGIEGGLTATYATRGEVNKIFISHDEKEINYQFIPDLPKFPKGYDLNKGYVTWEGSFSSDTTGLHKFIFTSAGYAKLWINSKLIFDRWRQCWNPSSNRVDQYMENGKRYTIKIEWIPDGGESFIALRYLSPLDPADQNRISFYSEVADQIDYYFIYGQNMDEVIGGYRTVTGKAPVMPKWALGFWQSRERYTTQKEILTTVSEFRKKQIPIDNIVLDWQYWPIDKWGDHNFDPARFANPDAMIRTLHDSLNTNIMISVWPKYYVGTENYKAMNDKGFLYKRNVEKGQKDWLGYVSTFYDSYNPSAREAFWNQINTKLFSKGIDAWWLDATEPDLCSNLPMDERKALMNPTFLGPSDKYFNAFALENAKGIYEGQRTTKPGQRVFILTRSAYAGLQHYSAANWSGDIASRWHDMKAQIPCGLNFCLSGIPYWTMDIGGFAVESRYYNPKGEDLEEWRELNTRWFQFGAFCPIFRSHGQYPYREMFNIAPATHQAFQAMLSFDKLRYRLMPYIYSLAGQAYIDDYTLMRGLAMDFGADTAVLNIDDQYMFGPSLMINPVCVYKARSRTVYLPNTSDWYDLFTGEYFKGGQRIDAGAPISYIPVFVKLGSIIPFGPEIQYTTQKPADPITLFVYTGGDGHFALYEDENINYNYEKGAYSVIPLSYRESDHTLTLGTRKGEFPGMLRKRSFRVVVVSVEKPVKLNFDTVPDKIIQYEGKEVTVQI